MVSHIAEYNRLTALMYLSTIGNVGVTVNALRIWQTSYMKGAGHKLSNIIHVTHSI